MISTVLQRLQEPGRAVSIASSLGVSESTVSRLKNEHLETLCNVLAHAGLKIVPVELQCFSSAKVNALLTLSKAHLDTLKSADQLCCD
jgi:hypothetical protein